ncbi:LAMI_0G14026g1_1 [Lachancea mirantina]|uniref:tRNA (uracil(54)-C(5))-methyltransferase n=1 Tax=Lachancea mirantina TaxID=1230905 RepID=A0A1G4KBV4_9SACH|nr:LAMI_0G14026g1_1 [Lachancea mirantina]
MLISFKVLHTIALKIPPFKAACRPRFFCRLKPIPTSFRFVSEAMSVEQRSDSKRGGVDEEPQRKPIKIAKKTKLKKYKAKKVDPTAPLGVLQGEIDELLLEFDKTREQVTNDVTAILNDTHSQTGPIASLYHRLVPDVKVIKLTASGDALAFIQNPVETDKNQVALIPFAFPGDVVDIKVFKTHPHYVECDLLEIKEPSKSRNNELIRCQYFGKCSGCQFQPFSYEEQLQIKRATVENAYKYFAPNLMQEGLIPVVGNTVGSPLTYGYRTKLTPHFDIPRKLDKLNKRPPLGFGQKGRPTWRNTNAGGDASILDVEECVIGTSIINQGMKNERAEFDKTYKDFKRGATILLREHTKILDENESVESQLDKGSLNPENGAVSYQVSDGAAGTKLLKTCVTDSRQVVTENIDGYTFNFSAGEFFQNNNSILPLVTSYVRDNLQIPTSATTEPHYLVDAYCGSGLFSITASKGVDKVIGVEVSADSVRFAEKNALANGVKNCTFVVGKAEKIFASIDTPSDRTSVILDPPRKGCDEVFLKQLADYYPARIVYVSCNVHSQARDVAFFLKNTTRGKDYKIESLRGFDFFPQTHHVEGVCVLSRY